MTTSQPYSASFLVVSYFIKRQQTPQSSMEVYRIVQFKKQATSYGTTFVETLKNKMTKELLYSLIKLENETASPSSASPHQFQSSIRR